MAVDLSISSGRIALNGALTALTLGPLWPRALRAAGEAAGGPLEIDLSAVDRLDSSGAAMVLAMERRHGGAVSLVGMDKEVSALLAQLRAVAPATQTPTHATAPPRTNMVQDLRVKIAFFGEALLALFALPGQLRMLRRADFFHIADRAGLQALSLVLTLGFLIGMILAFQSAVPMRQFGADLYVADLVTLSLCRELGPLMVAVILAGRTGSAYAAELGTMQVNDEIAALTTMNISPVTMLVLPRIGAAMLVSPALIVAMDAAGLLGMAVVLAGFGYPLSAIAAHIAINSAPRNFVMGLGKGVVFAVAVALIGCRAGLTARGGPRAVGESATAAVVGGIVATVVLDGIFAVIFYRLNL